MRRCSIVIALWIALFLAYAFALSRSDLPIEGALFGAAVTASLVWFGLVMMNGARSAMRDLEAREHFLRGERPRDGEFAAVIGEIRPTFEPLHAPLSGRECVAYRYDVGQNYIGFAVARCAIHSAHGTLTLGSFPSCTGFDSQPGDAQEYVDATSFQDLSTVMDIAKYTSNLHKQPTPLRIDWRMGAAPATVRGIESEETIVASGATVTAYGRYVASRNELVSDAKLDLRMVAGAEKGLPPGALSRLITGLALIVIANAGLWVVLGTIASL